MSLDAQTILHIAGIITLVGAVLFAVADVLLLAHHIGPRQAIPVTAVDFAQSPRWKRRAEILTTMSKMPWRRLVWGGLLGVAVTPLVMCGSWLLYCALQPAGPWLSVPVALLWLMMYPVGAFIHGSFIYFGGTIHAWNEAVGEAKARLEDLVTRMSYILVISYIMFFVIACVASGWYSVAVATGKTHLPRWMALANPILMTIVYVIIVRKILPLRLTKYVQGAGFNVVFFLFFGMILLYIW